MASQLFIAAAVLAEIALAAMLVAILVREALGNAEQAEKMRTQAALSPARQRAQMIARNWAQLHSDQAK